MSDHIKPLSVLVVEDNEDAAQSTTELLCLMGHTARVATCGAHALSEVAREMPDVILLDIGLPEMSGWEVAERLRTHSRGKQPVIIAVTGFGSDDDRWNSARVGIDVHLVKPADPEHLGRLMVWVRACLNGNDPPLIGGMVRACAWCKKVLIDGHWCIANSGRGVTVTHGMCPACLEVEFQKLGSETME